MACAMAHWQVTEAVRCGTPSGGLPLAGGSQLRVLGGVIVTEGDRGVTERRSAVPLSCVAIRRVGCTRSAASVHAQGAHYGIARVACGPGTDIEAVRRAMQLRGGKHRVVRPARGPSQLAYYLELEVHRRVATGENVIANTFKLSRMVTDWCVERSDHTGMLTDAYFAHIMCEFLRWYASGDKAAVWAPSTSVRISATDGACYACTRCSTTRRWTDSRKSTYSVRRCQ